MGQVPLSRGPVVPPTATPDEARAAMAADGTDWVAVCDGDRLRGWVGADERRRRGDRWPSRRPEPFAAVVHPDTTLKAALDGIVTSRTRVAVVVEPDEERPPERPPAAATSGMLTLDDLAEGVTR